MKPPEYLDDDQTKVWKATLPQVVARSGAITAATADLLGAYCVAVVLHRRAVDLVNQSNVLMPNPSGRVVQNPAVAVVAQQAQQIAQIAERLGLSPFDARKPAAGTNAEGETKGEQLRKKREARHARAAKRADNGASQAARRSQPRRRGGSNRVG